MATKKPKGFTKVTYWGDVKCDFDGGAVGCALMLFGFLSIHSKRNLAQKIAEQMEKAEQNEVAKDRLPEGSDEN